MQLGPVFSHVGGDNMDILCASGYSVIVGGGDVKLVIQKIGRDAGESVVVRCHDPEAPWVERVRAAASGERSVSGKKDGALHRLKLSEVYYFEVVDDASFIYTRGDVYEAREKLYEFEALCAGSGLFRCSKSMILNAEKIDYIRPSLSGRFEAVLSNGEKVVVSRRYVADLKRLLGV